MGQRLPKRVPSFKTFKVYSLNHLKELIWEDPTPKRGVLVSKNHEFCIQNEELCIKNQGIWHLK